MTTIVPVLLAGGSGTRLWPLSREAYPKQFLKLGGEHTLIQQTALRAQQIEDAAPPIVICGDTHRFLVAEQLREIGIEDATIILEPEGRNTAPAAAIAALQVSKQYGGEALVFLMSADHVVRDTAAFCRSAQIAAATAQAGRLMVFGIKPTRPETGYGYLKRGAELPGGAFELAQFVEKPELELAEEFIKKDDYSWNGGLFLFPARLFIDELCVFEPEMVAACEGALNAAKIDLDFIRLDAESFKQARSESIDYALMEKTDKAGLVPMDAGWDDVGSWSYMSTLPKDERGNYSFGDVMMEDCDNTVVHSEYGMVAALGLKDQVIVATKDAVLITTQGRVQDVKTIVSRLKAAEREETKNHPVVHRPWGSYESIAEGGRFQVKRIVVKPGQKLSSQMHHHRAEHWIVVKGTAKVTCNGQELLLGENQSTFIPLGGVHRLENPGKVPLELIEVQSGTYLGEDDIVRFDDIYGRDSKG
ncbi:mannose-1-phosphate guanylyltransferase/mannose-6-phosphate isomerase [Sinimarinibacterium sp. CAU 1509]|uniref:mannose-1-phosphate guanylyltransferase/mannose-6-phosphate isomerase n=1 Tax=Sinimarinibacterium sp. CAU 1509 TaxID=2562283 RepID=UPI0010ACAE17|nr:mannose-1-phosphate guanylyltransferase/mannose-6-phosphate isomerase [Sinimarinibacterium sp. CAU 1509]TJY61949.1 mannose-1-phosphate guanylyltransferase/mannose-6-phosphate isomerase [Sinimarinibacterium sp. CAU 1509]